jgi:NAD(P)-dependent dehydrogenase (short-subunit alcohol dehydrogenase family)
VSERVCIVTGAASGIGRATAVASAARGWVTILGDSDKNGLAAAAAEIEGSGGRAITVAADVSRADDCDALVAAGEELGGVDALCNIAGVAPFGTSIEQTSEEVWERTLRVNLTSVYLLSRRVIPQMRRRGGGVIVNMASVHAFAAMERSAPYAASKGAIVALTRQMAVDLAGDGIRVVAVAPGSVDTPMSTAGAVALGTTLDGLGFSRDPRALGRLGAADEVAEAISWLMSPAASFVNGTTFIVDGGLLSRLPGRT